MDFAITGMYRSGTTLCYNILYKLLQASSGNKVLETPTGVKIGDVNIHKFHEQVTDIDMNKYDTVYCYRDVLDCLSSFIIKYDSTFMGFSIQGKSSIEFINWMVGIDKKMQERSGFAEICYEECINDVDTLIDNIAAYYEINIPGSFDRDQFKIENIKKITDSRKEHSRIDNFHPKHVHNGEIGRWKSFFTTEQKSIIFNQTDYLDWKYNRYKDFYCEP